jgi:hypothetical protein
MANQQDVFTTYLNNEIKKLYSLIYDIEEKSVKDLKPSKVSYAKPPKEKDDKKIEKTVDKKDKKDEKDKKDKKHDSKTSKNKKPEVKDKKTEITERLQELKKLKEMKEMKEMKEQSVIKSLDEILNDNENVADFYNERVDISDSEKELYKTSIQKINVFLSQSFEEAIPSILSFYQQIINQLNEETIIYENILKEKQKNMRENEELLKKYKTEYLEKKERIYESKEAVSSSAAVSLPQLKEQYDTLNRIIPLIRNEFNKAKESDIAHRKKIDKYMKDIENITNIFNKKSTEPTNEAANETTYETNNQKSNDHDALYAKLETFEEEDWD